MAQVLHKLYEFAVGQASSSSSSEEEYEESSSYVTDSSEESRLQRRRRRKKTEKKKTSQYDDEESTERNRQSKRGSHTGSNHRQRESSSRSSSKTSSNRGKTSSTSTTSSSSTRKASSTSSSKTSSGHNPRRGTSSSSPLSSAAKSSKTNKPAPSNASSRNTMKERNHPSSSLSSSSRKQTLTEIITYTHNHDQKSERMHTARSSSATPLVDEDVSSITSSVALNEYSTMSRYIQRSKSVPRSSAATQTNNNTGNNNANYHHLQSKSTFETQLQHPNSTSTTNHRLGNIYPYESITPSPYYSFPNQNNSLLVTAGTISHGVNSSSSSMHLYQDRNAINNIDNNPTSSATNTYPIYPVNIPARTANTFDSLDPTFTPMLLYPPSTPQVTVLEAAHNFHPMATTLSTTANQQQPFTVTKVNGSNEPYMVIPSGVMQRSITTEQDVTTATRLMPQKRLGSKPMADFNEISPRISPTLAAPSLVMPYSCTDSATAVVADVSFAVPPNALRTDETNYWPNSSPTSAVAPNRLRTTSPGSLSDLDYVVGVDQEKQQLHDANIFNQSNDKVSSPVTQNKSSTKFHSSISKLVETFPALNGKKGIKHGVGAPTMEATAEKKNSKPTKTGNILHDANDSSTALLEKNLLRHNSNNASTASATGSNFNADNHNHTSITISAMEVHSVDKILQDLDERKFPQEGYAGGIQSYADAMSPARFSIVSDGQSLSLCYTASEQGSMTYSLSDVGIKENKRLDTVPNSEEALLIELLRQNTPQSHLQMLELLRRSPTIPNEGSFVSCDVKSDEDGEDDKRSESEDSILSLEKSSSSNDATETSSITLDEEEKTKLPTDRTANVYARTAVSLLNTGTSTQNNLVRDILKKTLSSPAKGLEAGNDCSTQLVESEPSNSSEIKEKNIHSNNSPDNVTDLAVEKSCESSQISLPAPMRIFSENDDVCEAPSVLQSDDDVNVSSCKPFNLPKENVQVANKNNDSERMSSFAVTPASDLKNDSLAEYRPSSMISAGSLQTLENEFNKFDGVESMLPPPPPPLMPPPKRKSGQSNTLQKAKAEGRDLSITYQPPSAERFHAPQNTSLPPPPPPSLPPEIIKVDTSNESIKVNLGSILAKRKAAATLIQKVSRRWIHGQLIFSIASTASGNAPDTRHPLRKSQEPNKEAWLQGSINLPLALLGFSSISIQRWFRRHILRQKYLRKRAGLYGLMYVERIKRGSGYDCHFHLLKLGAIQIQKTWRRSFCRNFLAWLVEQEYCVCVLQTFFRAVLNKTYYFRIRYASIVIQSAYRSMKARISPNDQSDVRNSGAMSEMFHANFDSVPEITSETNVSPFSNIAKDDWEFWGAFADVGDSIKTEVFSVSSFPIDPFFGQNSDCFSRFDVDFPEACENRRAKSILEDKRSALEGISPTVSVQKVLITSNRNDENKATVDFPLDGLAKSSQSSVLKDQPCINKSIPVQLTTKPQDTKEDDVSSYGSKSELSDSAWDRFDEVEDNIMTSGSRNRRIARVPILKQFLPTKSSSKKKIQKSRFAECNTQYIPPRIELSPTSEGGKPPALTNTHTVSPSPRGKSRKQIRSLPFLLEGDEPGFISPRPAYSSSPRSMFYSKKIHDEACEEIF